MGVALLPLLLAIHLASYGIMWAVWISDSWGFFAWFLDQA